MPLSCELLDRGVFNMPFLTATGQRVMAAIGADHRWIAYQTYTAGDTSAELQARRMLHVALAKLDPRPHLEVVS